MYFFSVGVQTSNRLALRCKVASLKELATKLIASRRLISTRRLKTYQHPAMSGQDGGATFVLPIWEINLARTMPGQPGDDWKFPCGGGVFSQVTIAGPVIKLGLSRAQERVGY